jgi:hypothetical protein
VSLWTLATTYIYDFTSNKVTFTLYDLLNTRCAQTSALFLPSTPIPSNTLPLTLPSQPLLIMPPKKKAKKSSSSSSSNATAAESALKKMVDKTIEAITCVCCLEVTRPPLYQCQNGHTLPCTDCRDKMVNQTCPTCQVKYVDATKGRNLSLEQTASDIEIECKRGCGSSIAYSSLVEHENDCVGKVAVRCARPNCEHVSTLWSAAIAHHKEVSQQLFVNRIFILNSSLTSLLLVPSTLLLVPSTRRHQDDEHCQLPRCSGIYLKFLSNA